MAKKPKDFGKQIDDATKGIAKEQREWKVAKGEIQRDIVRLKAERTELERKAAESRQQLDTINTDIITAGLRKTELTDANASLELANHSLETALDDLKAEFSDTQDTLTTAKLAIDRELEVYEFNRKQSIKESILATNQELLDAKAEVKGWQDQILACVSELDAIKAQLSQINQVYLDEAEEIKASNASTQATLEENESKVIEARGLYAELEQKYKELQYAYNTTVTRLDKAKEEHMKFLEYEKQARKLLEAKDKQLQTATAELVEKRQFVQNSRSFLSEL